MFPARALCAALLGLVLAACASKAPDDTARAPRPPGSDEALARIETFHAALLDVGARSEDLGQRGREAALRPVVIEVFDVPTMARASLGSTFDTLTPERQAQWIDVYTEFHLAAAAHNWGRDRGARFIYLGEVAAANDALLVRTRLDRSGKGVDVGRDYRMTRRPGEAWRVVDVYSPAGVSMVGMRRAEYVAILDQSDFDTLVTTMQERVAAWRR